MSTSELLRLLELRSFSILDTPIDPVFNDLVKLASQACETPIALVSLVDEKRQWFKACEGLDVTETPREYAFCAHAIQQDHVFVVNDATSDDRFKENPLVVYEPKIRFYAGAPLVSAGGYKLGTICVIDRKKRDLSPKQVTVLELLARQVVAQMQRHKIMIELQTGHSRVLSLVNRLPVGVLSEDARKRVQFTNDAYRRIFGLTESTDDFIGTYRPHAADLKSDLFRDPESFERKTAETLLLRKSIEIETFELADKKVIEREYLPIDDLNGQYQGALWLFRDITEKIHSEEVIASQRMLIAESSKMVALGEMAAGIAHEINNPLAIIQARAALLKEQSRKGSLSPLATQEGCEQIMAVVQRISKIVKGLRSFAREEKDGQWQKASFSELVEDTLAFCRERFKDGGVDLRIQPIPLDSQMDCRPVQISQVLLNLLNNAYDAVLPLAEKWIEIAFETRSDQVQISVCDSGFGVGREVREKIFQPFFTSKPAGSGTGLGLSVSKGIIDSHGGSLALDASSPHTRFVITLPREQGAR